MKNLLNDRGVLLFILSMSILLCSCDKDEEDAIYYDDCVFVENDESMDGVLDETEAAYIQTCIDNQYTDIEDINANLIGIWELVGHGTSWNLNVTQPCAHIVIEESTLTFDITDNYIDTTYQLSWDITSNGAGFRLMSSPESIYQINCTTFSSDYMFFDDRPVDGNAYIYRKVK